MLVALLASGGSALTLHAAAPSAARGVFGGVSRCAVARMDLVRQVNTPCNGVSPAAPCCCAAHITLPPACVRRHLRSLVRQVNTAEFEEEIQDCSTPIILDVFAVWCGPCQLMAPQLELVAESDVEPYLKQFKQLGTHVEARTHDQPLWPLTVAGSSPIVGRRRRLRHPHQV